MTLHDCEGFGFTFPDDQKPALINCTAYGGCDTPGLREPSSHVITDCEMFWNPLIKEEEKRLIDEEMKWSSS